jgi:hypothetical protein
VKCGLKYFRFFDIDEWTSKEVPILKKEKITRRGFANGVAIFDSSAFRVKFDLMSSKIY